jgi:hypothetical protein
MLFDGEIFVLYLPVVDIIQRTKIHFLGTTAFQTNQVMPVPVTFFYSIPALAIAKIAFDQYVQPFQYTDVPVYGVQAQVRVTVRYFIINIFHRHMPVLPHQQADDFLPLGGYFIPVIL